MRNEKTTKLVCDRVNQGWMMEGDDQEIEDEPKPLAGLGVGSLGKYEMAS